ncbi:hypothetical protein HPP92_022326 [Vanilla planifolia]|uniref:Uncharacterized protein n=1 Tax=Vanilla planifolia TaxID=51239 RepID=A0A835PT53_VANPL|nr:hypothetical protein HPP92_022326 [Vanilla planifolia]
MARFLASLAIFTCAFGSLAMGRQLDLQGAPSSAPSPVGDQTPQPDKSIAAAEVVLGGFATAVLAAIFCYIRVTRRTGHDSST